MTGSWEAEAAGLKGWAWEGRAWGGRRGWQGRRDALMGGHVCRARQFRPS